ncbi:hypothetical protein BD310DRAFT_833201 [Dichomitus squalens]|uniref:Integrase core domain-containing protein n=1 Tax=Dichomitus squalens TaxID=114155 RepID=A0A4Q9PH16_9APHY|nr:hypothetical protein BD310DRAFT_833201 [Dichomitus squalens]
MAADFSGPLLTAFRIEYSRFEGAIRTAFEHGSDTIVLERLGERLDEFMQLVHEHFQIFDPAEFQTIVVNLTAMQSDFLAWAYTQRSVSSIARFLGVHRHTVKRCLVDYGIVAADDPADPRTSSDQATHSEPTESDELLDPTLPIPSSFPSDLRNSLPQPVSTALRTDLTNDDIDHLLIVLRSHYHRAGLSVLDGMLRALGHRIGRNRLRQALLRVDPVRRVFERIRIRRREYKVAGPNALWHHDGQHGKHVHNIRIERLWVDVTAQVGAKWADYFTALELHHGLDINNPHHIWLLHRLFLDYINFDLTFFVKAWNEHKISLRTGPRRSPADMFGFDMLIHGVRGDAPADIINSDEELEVYGLDWEALQEDDLRTSHATNNPLSEGWSSWLGRTGPPEHLNEVNVESPQIGNQEGFLLLALSHTLPPLRYTGYVTQEQLMNRWVVGLATSTALFRTDFIG